MIMRKMGLKSQARIWARKLNPAANVIFAGAAAYAAELWWVCWNMCQADPESW